MLKLIPIDSSQWKYVVFCFTINIFRPNLIFASSEPFPIGARSWGIANANVAISDQNSVSNNPASLGFLKDNYVSTSYHARYSISGLQTLSFSGNYNGKYCNFGFNSERFGDKLYNEQKFGIALAKNTNRVSLGIKVSYFQAAIEHFISKKTALTEFGIVAKLNSKLNIGFHAYNLTGAKLFASQYIPTVLRLGFAFTPTKQILIVAEAEKNLNFPLFIKIGLEYQIVKNFYCRTGITSKINNAHFGFGLRSKQFIFDYAVSSHSALGFSHYLTISYQISKSKAQ
ncbi:hypothetical protein EMA8858_03586 [Emticicia aquatica]|uniref:Type IX secretion system membrane protein PorP/SprF n=1 Tax=Emticicia aquatica TaxID=1681835 RepID=A0ABN8F1N3_9BACT|nr:hypothetical protein [Emticicia aquatica]CAH0997453.1 hypothetical protein EMA8858_03586 [Emticicia aquatica]